MEIANLIPELKSMGEHFLLYAILSPIAAYAGLNLVGFVKKSWLSGSKLKRWIALTVIIFSLYVILLGF